MDIIQFIEDERFIGDRSLSDYQKTLLKVIYGSSLDKREKKIFKTCTKLKRYKPKIFKESTIIAGRRSGKSDKIASNVAIYEAIMGQHEKYLSVGEKGTVLLLATSKRQAKTDFGYIQGKLKNSEILRRMIENETQEEIRLRNRIVIAVYPCSDVTPRGISCVCAVLDELAYFKHEGVSIDKQIVDSIRPSLIQFPNSKLLKISSPSKKSGVVWGDYKDHYGMDSDVLVFQAPSHLMNTKISKGFVKSEVAKDPAFAKSEYLALFKDDLQDFLNAEALDAVIYPGRHELPYVPSMKLFAFCDSSGGKSEDMTLSIASREDSGQQILQICVRVKKAPFNPRACVKEFAQTLKSYNLFSVTGDRYSGEWVREAFRDEGIMYEPSELNKSQIYLEFLPLVMQQSISLLDHKEQTIQFRQLERRAGRNQDTIDHPRGLKDDICNSCAGSIVLLARSASEREFDEIFSKVMEKKVEEDFPLTTEEAIAEMEDRSILWLLGGELEPPRDQNDESVNERRKK